jgi:hypothetical protein
MQCRSCFANMQLPGSHPQGLHVLRMPQLPNACHRRQQQLSWRCCSWAVCSSAAAAVALFLLSWPGQLSWCCCSCTVCSVARAPQLAAAPAACMASPYLRCSWAQHLQTQHSTQQYKTSPVIDRITVWCSLRVALSLLLMEAAPANSYNSSPVG